MTFEEWMKNRGLSQSSIEKYAGAIDGPLTSWGLSYKFISSSLRKINSLGEFESVANQIKTTPEFEARNIKGHQMYSAALKRYSEFLETGNQSSVEDAASPHSQQIKSIETSEDIPPFIPNGHEDAREKVLREVVKRRGQPKFRSDLIKAYESKCAITGCGVLQILEAAHITPYLGPDTNMVSNGILLRSDIHTLWDLGLIAIHPEKRTVWISSKVSDDSYQKLLNILAFQPKETTNQPSFHALQQQWDLVTGIAKKV